MEAILTNGVDSIAFVKAIPSLKFQQEKNRICIHIRIEILYQMIHFI